MDFAISCAFRSRHTGLRNLFAGRNSIRAKGEIQHALRLKAGDQIGVVTSDLSFCCVSAVCALSPVKDCGLQLHNYAHGDFRQ